MQRVCWFSLVVNLVFASFTFAAEPLVSWGFDPYPGTCTADFDCSLDFVAWDVSRDITRSASLTQVRGSEPGGSVLNVFREDPAATNIVAMGNEGIGGAAVTRDIFHELGDQSEMTWSGWFRSADDETWSNGASLLSIPGHVEIRGGSGPFVGGMDFQLWQTGLDSPIEVTTLPLSYDRPDADWVFWAVSYDQTVDNGHVKFYRGTQADPVQLITQSTIVSPNTTSAPTSPLSIGNVTTGEQAFQSPFHGSIDFVRVHDQALSLLELDVLRRDEFRISSTIRSETLTVTALLVQVIEQSKL